MNLPDAAELVVVGAGPAGMAAAITAARLGVQVVLLDEQTTPGGQIYRAITETPLRKQRILGADYWRGAAVAQEMSASPVRHVSGASVWSVTRDREVGLTLDDAAFFLQAQHVILATGAQERPFPIPGWTLPGVMTAGAAQILLKSAGVVPEGRVVLAGTGPLLWLLASQILRAGGCISALLDTTPRANWRRALPHLPAFLASPYAGKGISLLSHVRRRVRVFGGVEELAAEGEDCLRSVSFRRGNRERESLPADLLLLHQGVVPSINLASAAGCRNVWDDRLLCFAPIVDEWGASTVEGIAIAGDGAGILGAEAAAERGRLAGLDAAFRLGRIDRARRDRDAATPRTALGRAQRGRAFLDVLYRPARRFRVPEGDTIVCRCEEVTATQIAEAAALGCQGPNQLKAFLRCGMGPCQGRLCGLTVTELLAEARGASPAEIGHYRLRPPVKPLTLGQLASLPKTEAAIRAVERRS
jgi:NADPH-dependent 2,4-dienoyl-CoA reductase/sulfur reductase-like enzyme